MSSNPVAAATQLHSSPAAPSPSLCREIDLQLRRRQAGKPGHYPGIWPALAVLTLPLVAQAAFVHYGDGVPHDVTPLKVCAVILTWLSSLRAADGSAASLAEEAQNHAPLLLRRVPGARGDLRMLLTKGAVVCAPLLLEWLLFLCVAAVVWLCGVAMAPLEALMLAATGVSALALSSALGFWLGARYREPERSANTARIATFLLLLGWGMAENVLPSPFLIGGVVTWAAMMFRSSPRVASVFQCSVLGTVVIIMVPSAFPLRDSIRLAPLSPLFTEWSGQPPWSHCALYLVSALALMLFSARQLRRG